MRTMTTTKKKTKTKTTKTKTRRRRRQPGRETSAAGRRAPCPPSPPPLPPPAGTLVAAPPPPRGRRARACAAGGVAPAWHEGSGGATAATPRRGLPPDRRGAGEGPTKPWRFRDAPKLGDQRGHPFQEHTPSLHRVSNSYVELQSFCGTAGPDIGVRPRGNPYSIWATGFWRGVVCTRSAAALRVAGKRTRSTQPHAETRAPRNTRFSRAAPRPPPPACIPVVTIPPVPAEAPIRAVPLVAAPPAVVLVVAAPTAAVAAAAVPAAVVLALVTLAIIGATSPTSTRCFPASAPARWACWICRPLC